MAIELTEKNDGKLIEVHVRGKLVDGDYRRFVPEFERWVARHGRISVLFEMSDFHGWEMKALWDDLKFDLHHFKDIERLAMVGEKKWQKWMAGFCKPFTTAAVRYFDRGEVETAREWLESGRHHQTGGLPRRNRHGAHRERGVARGASERGAPSSESTGE